MTQQQGEKIILDIALNMDDAPLEKLFAFIQNPPKNNPLRNIILDFSFAQQENEKKGTTSKHYGVRAEAEPSGLFALLIKSHK